MADDAKPSFLEIELVDHDRGIGSGDFEHNLNLSDVTTCWNETAACKNKGLNFHVSGALRTAPDRFPFNILGIDLR